MKWKRAREIDTIKGIDKYVRGFQLRVFQPSLTLYFIMLKNGQTYFKNLVVKSKITIKRPLQLVVPFEINKQEENETIRKPKRIEAINADWKRKVIEKPSVKGEC